MSTISPPRAHPVPDVVAGDLAPAQDDVDARAITTLRLLAADMVESANSGHPGMPMGCAPMAWTLWSRHLRHDPAEPTWPDRDRFVLSAGHGSALQYALLHLFGYDLPTEELRNFRQVGSATPGHPEYGHTVGVETTTGPLGQGIATAVGMALAERMLHDRFPSIVGHDTYVIAGDGCLMEGISHEAASLAGHLRLGRLTVLYDDNEITIDGSASLSCSDDVIARFASYGWHTVRVGDGNDVLAIDRAINEAKADDRPTLIAVRTVIGFGAPGIEGTSNAHGNPLGNEVMAATRQRFGWPDERFHVPADVSARSRGLAHAGASSRRDWQDRLDAWAADEPTRAAEWRRTLDRGLPADLDASIAATTVGEKLATRQASARVLAGIGGVVPELIGGSADLAGSTGTDSLPGGSISPDDFGGSTIHFGIREHAMAAALNGIAAHGGLRPFGSTFLVFSDYLRPALRLSALMRLPVVYVFTHDSVAVGEDGPTHQPVEHVESLRLIPGLAVIRPADDGETAAAWRTALHRTEGPTALILSRQALPYLGECPLDTISRSGARIVGTPVADPTVTILASGSEVGLACAAAELLAEESIRTRVVSVPWRERLEDLDDARRRAIIGDPDVTVAVEAGVPNGWAALTGTRRRIVGITRFGVSGPGDEVRKHLGLTAAAVADVARRELSVRPATSGPPLG